MTTGQKRYHAFLREAKNDGNSHKEALNAYRYYKAALGEQPKRGQYREYHHWVQESKTQPPPLAAPPIGGAIYDYDEYESPEFEWDDDGSEFGEAA